jgi:osmoprotectant transport system ATP-binding protein
MYPGRKGTAGGPIGDAMIEFRGVSKTYPGSSQPVVNDLSFEVLDGEICVLVGPSGCGKTTSMRMVNRLIEPSEGEILIDGEPNTAMSGTRLRRGIGYAIQQIGLFPHRTIADNIATVPHLLEWDKDRIAARVDELLELVGLDPEQYRDRYPAELSGGQQQRVGVARALAADPPIMLMDEPFGAVDPINRSRLQDEFLRIQGEIKKTIVFVTHDIDEAIKMGDKIAILKEGGILAQYDTPENILATPNSEFVSSFVGADRVLKRLSLLHVSDMELDPPNGYGDRMPRLSERMNLKDALSELIGSGAERGVVVANGDGVRGTLSISNIQRLSHRAEDEQRSE